MNTVTILGGTGMLGAMLVRVLAAELPQWRVRATARAGVEPEPITGVEWSTFDAESDDEAQWAAVLRDTRWLINAVGVIKPYIHDDNAAETARAVRVNALFPHRLAERTAGGGTGVIQIATDCVYSGARGGYGETDGHDALDVYGKSKSLGEVPAPHFLHLRCSIIGPERSRHLSLLDWFRGQPAGIGLNGFANHLWNGVTTLHFARVCAGLLQTAEPVMGRRHLLPADRVSKDELLRIFAREFSRPDLRVTTANAAVAVDRTLTTLHPADNAALWRAAGYAQPPTVADMVGELARHMAAGGWR